MAKGAIFHGMPPMHSRSVARNGTKSARYHGPQYPDTRTRARTKARWEKYLTATAL
jgi:hypothetical protein